MSKLDRLLAEHCPHGVDFVEIGDLVARVPNIRWDEHAERSLEYIDLSSVDRRTNRIVQTTPIDINSAPSRAQQVVRRGDVLFGATRPMLKRYCLITEEYDGQVASTGFCVLRPTERISSAWLYHLLGTPEFYAHVEANQRGASYPAISDALVKQFRIPVPPLAVQRGIVSILDKMESLKAELESELEYRSRQYAFYRDKLLAFQGVKAVRWVPMGEVGEFTRGRRFTKADVVEDGIPCINFGEIYTRYGAFAHEVYSHVRAELRSSLRFARTGDVILTGVSETVEDICKAVAWLGDDDVAVHDDCFAYRHSMDPKFVSYYLQTKMFHAEKAKHVARAKVKRISGEGLAKLTIPVPMREEQERIVAMLDKFDALVNDLTSGLPAEIAVRQKQYEYYRDKLLTFEEAS